MNLVLALLRLGHLRAIQELQQPVVSLGLARRRSQSKKRIAVVGTSQRRWRENRDQEGTQATLVFKQQADQEG